MPSHLGGLRERWLALPLVKVYVGLGGLESPASSFSANCPYPLCGPPFPQVTRRPSRLEVGVQSACRYAFDQGCLGNLRDRSMMD
jgi:hypothetical protein